LSDTLQNFEYLDLFQQIALKHPAVRSKLGLLVEDISKSAAKPEEMATSHPPSDSSMEQSEVPVQNLSPRQLHSVSVSELKTKFLWL